jgi:hypothetical protein
MKLKETVRQQFSAPMAISAARAACAPFPLDCHVSGEKLDIFAGPRL